MVTIYIIDGKTGCRDVIDVGETSYSIPLIDDLSNSGYLSIVLATMNGEVHCFEAMRSGPLARIPWKDNSLNFYPRT